MKHFDLGLIFIFLILATGCTAFSRDAPDHPDVAEIQMAARSGDLNLLHNLLAKNPELVNASRNVDDKTPLHWVAYFGHMQALTLLIKYNVNIDVEDTFGITPLGAAALGGHTKIVQTLLDLGADINNIDRSENSILDAASHGNHCDTAIFLLERGIEVNGGPSKFFPIDRFVSVGDFKCVHQFLNHGAGVNEPDINDYTRMHWLAKGNVISRQENLMAKLYSGREKKGPLQTDPARYQEIFDLLVQNNALLSARNNRKETPLHIAAATNNRLIANALITAGADINSREGGGRTPLFSAVSKGNTDLVKLLITKKADVNAKANGGYSPLLVAIRWGEKKGEIVKIARLLIDAGADVNIRTPGGGWGLAGNDGMNALQQAASSGYTGVVELLIDSGANVNAVFMDGRTPLYWAARAGHKEVVEKLIQNGANVNAKASGRSALKIARKKRRNEIVKLLVKHGAKE